MQEITLATGVYRTVRFRSCGTVGYGPTMWVKKIREGVAMMHDHDSNAGQRKACQLCQRHIGTKSEGQREPFSCSLNEADQ